MFKERRRCSSLCHQTCSSRCSLVPYCSWVPLATKYVLPRRFFCSCVNCSLPGSLPGTAAPGIFIIWRLDFSTWTVLVQPIGLVDYVSLKKSIWRVRLFSRRFLKQTMRRRRPGKDCSIDSPVEKRSTIEYHNNNFSSPVSSCVLWLQIIQPCERSVTKE